MNDAPQRATARTWVGLAVLVLPMLLIAINGMVLFFALADITTDLEPTGAQQLWILDIYALMLAGFLITMSSLGDRFWSGASSPSPRSWAHSRASRGCSSRPVPCSGCQGR